ncbi:MAG: HAMP domain-containing histidine kinase [Ruminococcaceae bacterium]|nr:HAMP domain-containing histidine kinase [Oscillospiraceae bacterium]
MIYRLQRRFIVVCAISIFLVVFLIFAFLAVLNFSSMNNTLDTLTDSIEQGGGKFPDSFDKREPRPDEPKKPMRFDVITPETRFSTRHFTVWLDQNGEFQNANTDFIYSVDTDIASEYAKKVYERGQDRGWISNYRYKLSSYENNSLIVFVDGSFNRNMFLQSLLISAAVLVSAALVILFLILILSKKAVKPVAESYEKQKQFITDANHELKTPLTLILANLDLAQNDIGENEWLEDIRSEGIRMAEMVDRLVELTRMDEDGQKITRSEFFIDDMILDAASDFTGIAGSRGINIHTDVEQRVTVNANETMISRLIGILLDNAVKYCDVGGDIRITLKKKRNVTFSIENTYATVDNVDLDRLFDRFYRSDRARRYAGGHGIGLSTAKAIVQKHKGEISCYKKGSDRIGFKVIIK